MSLSRFMIIYVIKCIYDNEIRGKPTKQNFQLQTTQQRVQDVSLTHHTTCTLSTKCKRIQRIRPALL